MKSKAAKQVYFELNKTCGATALTQTTCCHHAQVRTRQHVKTRQPHTESMSAHSFTQAWAHRHRQTVHTVVPNNLASHAHVTLPSTIVILHFCKFCICTSWWLEKHTTSASCRGSRPSWALVGAGCSNQIAQGQVPVRGCALLHY